MENFDAKKFALTLKCKTSLAQIAAGVLCIGMMASVYFTEEIALGRVIVALLLYYLLNTVIVLRANAKLQSLLYQDLAPEQLLDVLREGKIYSRSGLVELQGCLAAGQWQRVADICAQKLNDPKYRLKKHHYMGFLADMYFNLADDVRLREVCDAFDAYAAVSKRDAVMQRMRDPMAYYRDYLNGAYERCFSHREKQLAQAAKQKSMAYATMIRDFEHAVVCLRAGRTEEARTLFAHVATDAPQLALASLAQTYLEAMEDGTALTAPIESVSPSGTDALSPLPRAYWVLRMIRQVAIIVSVLVLAVAIFLLALVKIYG